MNLVGVDGNAYAVLAEFQRRARLEGWTPEELRAVIVEATSRDYAHLLATLTEHIEDGSFGDEQ